LRAIDVAHKLLFDCSPFLFGDLGSHHLDEMFSQQRSQRE
jgi:hypothetical protein